MKTKFTIKYAFLLFCLCGLTALKSVAQASKNVPVTGYSAITISSGIDLYLTQSNSENIRISGNEDLIKDVIVEKSGSTLVIKYKEGIKWNRMFKKQSTKAYVNYKTLNALTASGGSDVFSQSAIKTDHITITASGGSDMKLELVTKDLVLHSSGGSDINLKGSAVNMEVHSSGGSDVNAYDFIAENAKVSSSGGSDANIHVTKALEASASGGSDIHYKGDAAVKNNSSKSGDVTKVR